MKNASPAYRWLGVPLGVFFALLTLLSPAVPLVRAQDGHLQTARDGLGLLDAGVYNEAEKLFTRLIAEDFLLKDFAYFWRARAYERMEDYEHALRDIAAVREKYPDSPALRESLKLEIAVTREQNREDGGGAVAAYESYLGLYPDDRKMQFEYAHYLKDRGAEDEALRIFRKLYIDASDFSREAALQFDTGAMDAKDLMQRGDNLLRQWNFSEAETAFTQARLTAPEELKDDINEKIALSQFRQKRYGVSAERFGSLNDRYLEAVSYLRGGDQKMFAETLDALKTMNDPRRGALLIAFAADKRRSGQTGEALAILKEAYTVTPFQEQALWETGWTHYLAGDFASAIETFGSLYARYQSKKYLYWMLRCTGKMSSDPVDKYRDLCFSDRDFYGMLGCARSGEKMKKVRIPEAGPQTEAPSLSRFSMLKALGLREEAVRELSVLARSFTGSDQMLLYSRELRDIGEYRNAMAVASRLPYSDEIHALLYPLAYWDIIREASRRFGVNPLYVLSIAREESRLDPEARSVAGAVGLMQLMPETASRLSGKIDYAVKNSDQFFDVRTNIMLGSCYLKTLLDRYRSITLATAAYNAGERAVQGWIEQVRYGDPDEFIEDIPYQETRNYVKKVLTTFSQYVRASQEEGFEDDLLGTILISFRQNQGN